MLHKPLNHAGSAALLLLSTACLAAPPKLIGADLAMAKGQAMVASAPSSPVGYDTLAQGMLQKARENGDVSYYLRAEATLAKAREVAPDDLDTLGLVAALRLQQHRFEDAIAISQRVLKLAPQNATAFGVIGDCQVELGNYDAAFAAYQTMNDIKPNIAAYSRAAYARALIGDMPGAKQFLKMSADAGPPRGENTAWVLVQLGHECFNTGDLAGAEHAYLDAIFRFPNYIHADAGLGRVAAARGQTDQAIAYYKKAVGIVPLHDYEVALGDLYAQKGDTAQAERQYALVEAVAKINHAAGIMPGVEMAEFYVDHNRKPREALVIARSAAARQKDIRTFDGLAWALYANHRYPEALAAERQAMRLGTKEATYYYHLGKIQNAMGHAADARSSFQTALAINPYFQRAGVTAIKKYLASSGGSSRT